MSVFCGNCKQQHATSNDVRKCYQVPAPAYYPSRPAHGYPPRRRTASNFRGNAYTQGVAAHNVNAAPTDPQLWRINKEAVRVGESITAWPTTRQEASTLIATLIAKANGSVASSGQPGLVGYGTQPVNQPVSAAAPIPAPVVPPVPYSPPPRPALPSKPEPLDERMVKRIPDGRYAVENNDCTQICFLRVRTYPQTAKNKLRGATVVQSKSADRWNNEYVYWPSGRIQTGHSGYLHGTEIPELLIQVIANPQEAALTYSKHYDECTRCGIDLTDKRSRFYGIGPECEKHRPDVINYVHSIKGEFDPNAVETE